MHMAQREKDYFEEAIKEGKSIVTYHSTFNSQETTEYEVDMNEMYQTNINTGTKRKLIRLATETDHMIFSPVRAKENGAARSAL